MFALQESTLHQHIMLVDSCNKEIPCSSWVFILLFGSLSKSSEGD